jgi:peptidoglycan-N-acetylglucosamine deacetylase
MTWDFLLSWARPRATALSLAAASFLATGLVPAVLNHGRGPLYALEPWAPHRVALTFDDGPHPLFAGRLLAALQHGRARATFFVVGRQAERNLALLAKMARQGSELANHTSTHPNLTKLDIVDALTELKSAQDVIENVVGARRAPHLFRPPGGRFNARVLAAARAAGYDMVLWTALPRDHDSLSADEVFNRVLAEVGDGGVVLLHSGVPGTLEALPRLLRVLRARGYRCVTVSDLLADGSPGEELWLNPATLPRRSVMLPPDVPVEEIP